MNVYFVFTLSCGYMSVCVLVDMFYTCIRSKWTKYLHKIYVDDEITAEDAIRHIMYTLILIFVLYILIQMFTQNSNCFSHIYNNFLDWCRWSLEALLSNISHISSLNLVYSQRIVIYLYMIQAKILFRIILLYMFIANVDYDIFYDNSFLAADMIYILIDAIHKRGIARCPFNIYNMDTWYLYFYFKNW